MASAAERMKGMRERRRVAGVRELRLVVRDARDPEIKLRVAEEVASLDPADEEDAMLWIEAVTADEEWDVGSKNATR